MYSKGRRDGLEKRSSLPKECIAASTASVLWVTDKTICLMTLFPVIYSYILRIQVLIRENLSKFQCIDNYGKIIFTLLIKSVHTSSFCSIPLNIAYKSSKDGRSLGAFCQHSDMML